MVFYSGFSLKEDDAFFGEHLDQGKYVVAGFSYGAIKAFEYALKASHRVDKVQLFSPAFFQTKNERYFSLQLGAFSSDPKAYLRLFMDNCFSPALNDGTAKIEMGKYEDLKALLHYVWSKEKVELLLARGVEIEVFLGAKDKIIDSKAAFDFFSSLTQSYFIKDAGHLLKSNKIK